MPTDRKHRTPSERLDRRHYLNEEMTKSQIEDIVSDEINKLMKSRDFKKEVTNITADVVEEFLDNLWKRRGFWKGMVKRS